MPWWKLLAPGLGGILGPYGEVMYCNVESNGHTSVLFVPSILTLYSDDEPTEPRFNDNCKFTSVNLLSTLFLTSAKHVLTLSAKL